MIKNSIVGYPRIGEQRELKKALELFWNKEIDFNELEDKAKELKKRHWNYQKDSNIELISSNDFSYYDNILDTSILLGAIPKRFRNLENEELYFAMARGNKNAVAMEMTKWFNTNYHYIVPELSLEDEYKLNSSKIINEYKEAKELGIKTKINLIGPFTYLSLAKRVDGGDCIELLAKIKPLYEELLQEISTLDDEIFVQIDEPIFSTDKNSKLLGLLKSTYEDFCQISANIKIIVTTYFDHSIEATKVLIHTPIYALGLDFISGKENLQSLELIKMSNKKLFAGVVNGKNIWKNDFEKTIQLLDNISNSILKDNIVISTSCSLLHVPYTLKYEEKLDTEIKSWLSFANEKLEEIRILSKIFFNQELTNEDKNEIEQNRKIHKDKKSSNKIHDMNVQNRIKNSSKFSRDGIFEERIKVQKEILKYPELTTTTIGSFPQTPEIRKARLEYKKGLIDKNSYEIKMKEYIDYSIKIQEELGLDILVHGEPERNDMVEYFGEQLKGYGFTQNAWVQSYGSRCVKPPFIYGDISRPKPMTVQWLKYAQSKTSKVVKGMLTGPVTILNWSFVRDDKERSEVATQIALAINDEIDDLQKNGIKIIQVDEAAFKEGYPLRDEKRVAYEKWAVESFKFAVSSADAKTQIHTHMCYSDFNDIIKTIEDMDADVISIETARSGNKLLKIFAKVGYKQEVGPGVYDIHSPRIPSVEEIEKQIKLLLEVLPKKQLWINPDCGLKTRKWEEVIPSLKNMVIAVNNIRKENG
ncbi:MAG: 5-methyltetrahydropteroyltriglutamate--homocysteine S-methyltransferase [Arcobacter sp.]|nr:MAG: 5-methyltetrahydropteroyltriglutamate--homocysteine S-methyltransferase [Arcobacter sp.]